MLLGFFFLQIQRWIPQAHSAPYSEIRPVGQLQFCTPLVTPLVSPVSALSHSLSLPHCSIANHWAPGPFLGVQRGRHPSTCVLVLEQPSLHSSTRDTLCKHFALPDQITWPKVSHMMGCWEIERSEQLWFHLSQVKHLNQRHFYASEVWGPTFFDHPKNAVELFSTEINWG